MAPETTTTPDDALDIPQELVQPEAPTFFQNQRLCRPREENPIAEAHYFFGIAEAEFTKVKAMDEAGETDSHPRLDALHASYTYLRQAYVLFNEQDPGNIGVNMTITRLYKEITDYDLRLTRMTDEDRVNYVSAIDMDVEAEAHLTKQGIMPIYDSLLSSPMSVEGFDIAQFSQILGNNLQRYFPFITDVNIYDKDGECKLDVKSNRAFSQSELKVLSDMQECISLIASIGAIHNHCLAENGGEMDREQQIELLEYYSQLTKRLHGVHKSTNAHVDRLQKFWKKFVDDPILAYAPLLHDNGKIGVSSFIVDKPAGINRSEIDRVRTHPTDTAKLDRNLLGVKNFSFLMALDSSHHINYALKAASYPDYFPGNKIKDCPKVLMEILPNLTDGERSILENMELSEDEAILVRLFLLLDVLEAITGDREYRDAEAKSEAIKFIRSKAGSLLDPNVASFVFQKLKDGGFDEELVIPDGDDEEIITAPVFHYGQDILAFLEAEKAELARVHGINVDTDIARLKNGLSFPTLKLSVELIRANIYTLFQRRQDKFKLSFEVEAEVDEVLLKFLEWAQDNNIAPEPADTESVESALEHINERAMAIAS